MAIVKQKQEPRINSNTDTPVTTIGTENPYRHSLAHRRLIILLHCSFYLNLFLLFLVTSLGIGFAELFPLKETRLALVRSDSADNRLYAIEPISPKVEGFDLLLASKAKRAVELLLEIDSVTQERRFKELVRLTDPDYLAKFKEDHVDTKAIDQAISRGLTRSITVETANKIKSYDDVHQYSVDYIQRDYQFDNLIEEKKLRAYMNLTTRPQEQVAAEDKYENPLGIVMLDMTRQVRD